MTRFFGLLVLICSFVVPAHALEPDRREVIVVHGRSWDGYGYKETFTPSTQDRVALMAGNDNALTFVRTQEYYWPLSRQVYVDFEAQNDVLKGVLQIEQEGKAVADVPLQVYSIIYPKGALNGDGSLIWGDAAASAYSQYQTDERAFARALVAAQRANTAYEQQLLASGAAQQKGVAAEVIPPPAPIPEPSLRLVTQPVPGYRVALEPGVYQAVLSVDGKVVAGTERTFSVIDLKGRDTLVADIVPEERWTRPLASNSATAKIYVRPGSVFYLTLSEATRFDETEYLPVTAPQAEAVVGRTIWVRRKPSDQTRLLSEWGGAGSGLDLVEMKVEQTEGSGFGYRMRPARSGEQSDLIAFPVSVPQDEAIRRGSLHIDETFRREVVVVHPRDPWLAALLASIPLCGFLIWAAIRQMRARAAGQSI